MSSVSKLFAALTLLAVPAICAAAPALRVCADPANLPYSNIQQQGFENRIAGLIAQDFGMQLTYYWFPQQETFFNKTLESGKCDLVMSVPVGFKGVDVTHTYYASSYVFVSRRARNLHIRSFDDPRLKSLRVGVYVLDDSEDSVPPVYALATRGIVRNVVGYSIFGHSLAENNPTADLINAVARGNVDVAIAWGPVAGYLARRLTVPLAIAPIAKDPMHPNLPFAFAIGMGVRKGDSALKHRLDAEIARRRAEISKLLQSYGIPQVSIASPTRSTAEN